jgi:hypothetical protein
MTSIDAGIGYGEQLAREMEADHIRRLRLRLTATYVDATNPHTGTSSRPGSDAVTAVSISWW